MKRVLLALLLVPSLASAQLRNTASLYLGADAGVVGDPLLVGASFASEVGPIGFRLGGAIDLPDPAGVEYVPGTAVEGVWSGDADLLVFFGNPTRHGVLTPFGTLGVGLRGIRGLDAPSMAATWSYGAGVRLPLLGPLGLEGELRHRLLLADGHVDPIPGFSGGFEARVGANLRMGSGPVARPPTRTVPVTPGPARGRPMLGVPARAPAASGSRATIAAQTLTTAERYLGTPYVWGGNFPHSGFDCSGFIRYVFQQHGITVPRVSRDQARHGTPLPLSMSAWEPGDVLAFASDGRTVDHTAIYAGNGRIIHSSSSGGGVRYDDLHTQRGSWYMRHVVAARRVIDTGWWGDQ